MPTVYGSDCIKDRFMRPFTLSTTPSGGVLGWTVKDTSSSGTPTYLTASGEGLVLTLASTSEAEIVTAYQNDVLPFFLNKLKRVSFTAKVSGIDAVTTLVLGVASAQNDTADTVTTSAWFRMEGSASTSAVVVETDDNVTNNDDKATGKSLSSTLKKMTIDFSEGLSKVRFIYDGDPVGTTYDMSGAASTDKVQLFIQLQKASGTGTPAVTIREVEVEYTYADG